MMPFVTRYARPLFWGAMALALASAGLLFKDLADVSQWLIQSPRESTMWVWYHRYALTAVAIISFAIALWVLSRRPSLTSKKALAACVILFAFLLYSGMINPHIMMRDRMDNGVFVSVETARKYYSPDESVIVLDINGAARAHSDKQLLRPHVAGNGELGGENVVMTYCGLTNLGMAYTPEIDGKALQLAPMNQLENNLVMWDKVSGEPIQQLWGQKEADINQGGSAKMREWPTFRMPFSKFAEAYPNGEVFLNDYLVQDMKPSFWENPFLAIYDPIMEAIFDHAIVDQATNEDPTFPTIQHKDPRLPNKTLVWGLNVGTDYVAYTEDFVRQHEQPINTEVGGKNLVIAWDNEYQSLGIYYNPHQEPVVEIDFFGNSNVGKLNRVETVKAGAYWIIWANFFPETDINRV